MALALHRKREGLTGDEEPDLTPLIDCVFLLLILFPSLRDFINVTIT